MFPKSSFHRLRMNRTFLPFSPYKNYEVKHLSLKIENHILANFDNVRPENIYTSIDQMTSFLFVSNGLKTFAYKRIG